MNQSQFITFMDSYGGMTLIIITIVVVIISLVVKIWPTFSKMVHIGNVLGELPETIDAIKGKIEKIETAVARVEKQVTTVSRIVANHEREIRK